MKKNGKFFCLRVVEVGERFLTKAQIADGCAFFWSQPWRGAVDVDVQPVEQKQSARKKTRR